MTRSGTASSPLAGESGSPAPSRSCLLGARVFVRASPRTNVGVGTVVGEAQRFVDAEVLVDGSPSKLATLQLQGNYRYPGDEASDDAAEYIVPVEWQATKPRDDAFWKKGMFANQNSACRLSNQFTIDEVSRAFDVGD